MARDKRKVVIQSDNEARHSPRQKRARPLMQSRSGVVISEPTKRHVTSQAKHVEARTKARFDHPATKRTEAKHVEARTKARFDRSTTKPTTTPPHPRTSPPTTSPTCPPFLGVCADAPGVDLSRRDVREFFSTLEDWRGGYRELHFSIRGRADIISSDTIATAFGLPSSAPPEARFAPQSRPAFPRIARILAPQGTRCRSAITRLEMPQILWFVDQASGGVLLNSSWIPSFIFSEGEGETVSFSSKLSHSFASIALILLAPSWTSVTPSLIVVWLLTLMLLISGFGASYFSSTTSFGCPEPTVPISTPAVPVSDLPRPSQPQVVDATSSTLSIMARLDTLQELFVSMDSRIDARLNREEILFTPADTSLEVDGGHRDIRLPARNRLMVRSSFVRLTLVWTSLFGMTPPMVRDLGEAITPIVEITDQATTPMLEAIDGVVTPIIGA
ncbi:hypothetical protein CK203_107188 [Vitis vinifera]|uniref:Uncharacterized protein n=1 Tax=Vitis vinifera TaxID=29760 RepID=A0A438DBM9_VITVI|nr:hypothetical protein CK203_107188 [Vitis vinifera]